MSSQSKRSPSNREHARRRLDAAVRHGFAQLRRNGRATNMFRRLLVDVREGSDLLRPSCRGDRDVQAVRALVRLARYHREHTRSAAMWACGDGRLYPALGSLAAHVLGAYPTPPILTPVWLAPDDPASSTARRWFIEHARGRPFREVTGLPVALTRRMEHIFLRSPPHLPLVQALRRAEVLGLDGEPALAEAVVRTRLGESLADGAFWRSVLHFFVNFWDELGAQDVADFVAAIHRLKFQGARGGDRQPPMYPDFAITGRTPRSLRRWLAQHGRPPRPPAHGPTWAPSGFGGLVWPAASFETGVQTWQIVELLAASELREEGGRMHHCVGGYVGMCARGTSSIWSLRALEGEDSPHSRFTIEVEPKTRRIVQIRGFRNRRVHGRPARMIAIWAGSEGLEVAPGA